MSNEPSPVTSLVRFAAGPFALGAGATVFCQIAVGAGLGLYFGGLAMAAILVPALASQQVRRRDAFLAAAAVIDGIGAAWLVSLIASPVTFGQWLAAYVVLAAVGMALLGVTLLLRRVAGPTLNQRPRLSNAENVGLRPDRHAKKSRDSRIVTGYLAAAVTTVLFIAWFSWPVWLSPFVSGHSGALVVAWLAPAHPLLAINRVFIDSGLWTQQPLMYPLTALGQDIPFSMPTSILACVLAHAIIALAAGLPAAKSSGPGVLGPRRSAASPAP
jgi:MFS family permease